MGKRGPQPEPAEVLRLRGSSHQYERKGEPSPPSGDPAPPDWLLPGALAMWHRMVERLRGMQVLSPNWAEGLAAFCEAWDEYERLVAECQQTPFTTLTTKGAVVRHPVFRMRDDAFQRALRLGARFGWTPADKTGLRVEKQEQATKKKRFFG